MEDQQAGNVFAVECIKGNLCKQPGFLCYGMSDVDSALKGPSSLPCYLLSPALQTYLLGKLHFAFVRQSFWLPGYGGPVIIPHYVNIYFVCCFVNWVVNCCRDAKRMEEMASELSDPSDLTPSTDGNEVQKLLGSIADRAKEDKFLYTKFFAIGLFRLLELTGK